MVNKLENLSQPPFYMLTLNALALSLLNNYEIHNKLYCHHGLVPLSIHLTKLTTGECARCWPAQKIPRVHRRVGLLQVSRHLTFRRIIPIKTMLF